MKPIPLNKLLKISLMAVSLVACNNATPPVSIPALPTPKPLVRATSCEDLLGKLKEQALLDLKNQLSNCNSASGNSNWGSSGSDVAASPMAAPSAESTSDSTQFTGTNLQEANVDEADRIKTDGTYIYAAHQKGVDIFKAWPISDFNKVATYATENSIQAIYLHEKEMILLEKRIITDSTPVYPQEYVGCFPSPIVNYSFILQRVNIENPANPIQVSKKELGGNLMDSRLIDGELHLVLNGTLNLPEKTAKKIYGNLSSCQTLKTKIEELRAEIQNAQVSDWYAGTDTNCSNVYLQEEIDPYWQQETQVIYSLDLKQNRQQITFVQGQQQNIYASNESVYLYSSQYSMEGSNHTGIHRFDLNPSSGNMVEYFGSGAVPHSVGTSFSLSEYNQHLRVVSGEWNEGADLYILDAEKPTLPVVGTLEKLGKGESIYAVRFVGDRGYVVTFKKIDPLFVIDLKTPTQPKLLGELKVPGYSTYLHPFGENKLIGLGKDADDQGSFAWFQGLKLSTFDVGSTPAELDSEIIGGRYSESAALTDHHAFTFLESDGLLALPVTLFEKTNGGSSVGRFLYRGVHVYHIGETGSITSLAEIKLDSDSQGYNPSPQRTMLFEQDGKQGLYILDHEKLHQVDLDQGNTITKTQTLSSPWQDSVYYYDDFVI